MAHQEGALNWQELLLPRKHTSLRVKLRLQIEKDFGRSLAGDDWPEELAGWLQELAEAGQLSAVLYRIDLPEKDYQLAINTSTPWLNLSLSVLQREAEKVILREQLSGRL